jgi:hypothetical protein
MSEEYRLGHLNRYEACGMKLPTVSLQCTLKTEYFPLHLGYENFAKNQCMSKFSIGHCSFRNFNLPRREPETIIRADHMVRLDPREGQVRE